MRMRRKFTMSQPICGLLLAVAGLCASVPAFTAEAQEVSAGSTIAIIDTHAHIIRSRRGNATATASQALHAMAEFNVAQTILLPPPFPAGHPATYGRRELEPVVRSHPGRFAFVAGGESLNPMIHDVAPENVTPAHIERFRKEAALIVESGAAGFGEVTAEHFSSGRGGHPYESTRPDHPLFLALADIAAQNAMPIDLHMEAVPRDMQMPDRMQKGANPERLKENISGFERLLAHNRNARIIWAHCGWDLTGERTVPLMRSLLEKHPNLYMSIKLDPRGPRRTWPFAADGALRPEWVALFRAFPDRFVIGSDQFFDEGSERLALTRKLVDALPADIARLVANENARRIYRLDAKSR
jgi:predicted TIM-barrel fold metal-dependent hydrolase